MTRCLYACPSSTSDNVPFGRVKLRLGLLGWSSFSVRRESAEGIGCARKATFNRALYVEQHGIQVRCCNLIATRQFERKTIKLYLIVEVGLVLKEGKTPGQQNKGDHARAPQVGFLCVACAGEHLSFVFRITMHQDERGRRRKGVRKGSGDMSRRSCLYQGRSSHDHSSQHQYK